MKSRLPRVTLDEALAMQENEKEQSCAISHHYTGIDYQFSKGFRFSPKLPLIPDKASKVAEVEDNKGDQDVALLSFEESRVFAH